MPILLSFLTFVTTYLGGLISLRYKDKLNVVLGFTAGVLIAVVAFAGVLLATVRDRRPA